MDLLKMRRGSQDHSQWLYKLETAIELTKYEEWSKEKMIVHLFLESADTEMSKLATTMLAKDTVSLSELRIQIRAIVLAMPNLYNPIPWEMAAMGQVLVVLGASVEASGVGIAIARPTILTHAGGYVPIVIDVAIDRSSVIRKKR